MSPLPVDELFPQTYQELHDLAEGFMRRERSNHTLHPTELINEAYVRLKKQNPSGLLNRSHFLGVAALAMRRVLVDHARFVRRKKRSDGRKRVPLPESTLMCEDRPLEILALDEALEQLKELNAEHARIVELRFFGGLTISEAAAVLELSVTSVERKWRAARAWLYKHLIKD